MHSERKKILITPQYFLGGVLYFMIITYIFMKILCTIVPTYINIIQYKYYT